MCCVLHIVTEEAHKKSSDLLVVSMITIVVLSGIRLTLDSLVSKLAVKFSVPSTSVSVLMLNSAHLLELSESKVSATTWPL